MIARTKRCNIATRWRAQSTGEIDISMEDIAFGVLRTGRIRRVLIKLNKVHEVISEMARITGIVKDDDLFDALRLDHGIRRLEAARLIELLVRAMAIYSPKPGYFKEGFEFP